MMTQMYATTFKFTFQNHSFGNLIFDKTNIRIEFKKYIIVFSKFKYTQQIIFDFMNMKMMI